MEIPSEILRRFEEKKAQEEKRPFYIIAHHCNTIRGVNKAIKQGANAIECDITPYMENGQLRFSVFHKYDNLGRIFNYDGPTSHKRFNDYLQNLAEHIGNERLALILFDFKTDYLEKSNDDLEKSVSQFIERLKDCDIPHKFCVISTEKTHASAVFNTIDKLEYRCFKDVSLDPEGSILEKIFEKPQYPNTQQWIELLHSHQVTFAGFGIDSKAVNSAMRHWDEVADTFKDARDSNDCTFSKIYFWTLSSESSSHKAIKWGVDGIIHNFPDTLHRIITGKYHETHRIANQRDTESWYFETQPLNWLNQQLILPCEQGDLESVKEWLDRSANINCKDIRNKNDGKDYAHDTPLEIAIWFNRNEVVRELLKRGADIDKENASGNPPFVLAGCVGNIEAIKLLLEKGVEINERGNFGRTALHWAARNGKIEAVEFLIGKGADINLRDQENRTAFQIIKKFEHKKSLVALFWPLSSNDQNKQSRILNQDDSDNNNHTGEKNFVKHF